MRARVVLVAATAFALALFGAPALASAASSPIVITPAPAATNGQTGPANPAATAAIIQPNGYVPVTPCRIFDTRPHGSAGICAGAPPLAAAFGRNLARDVPMSALLGGGVVPWGTTAVVLNITAVNATTPTYLTAYPAGVARPLSSSLNVNSASAVANLVTVQLGPEGLTGAGLHFYNYNGSVNVIADLEGYFTPLSTSTAGYNAVSPCRAFDTRGGGGALCTGAALHVGKVGPGRTLTVKIAGIGGLPATGVRAVVLNLTAVNATAQTYEKVYPGGGARPLASNLNVGLRAAVANLVTVPLNASAGTISVYNLGGTVDLLADLAGYYSSTGASYYPITPCRAVDSRSGMVDCLPKSLPVIGPLLGTEPVQLSMPGVGPIPTTPVIKAVAFNLTVVNSSTSTYVTAFPADSARPNVSDIDVHNALPLSNQVIVRVPTSGGKTGLIQVQNQIGSIDFVIDIAGYYL
jgi:hypothetical protein